MDLLVNSPIVSREKRDKKGRENKRGEAGYFSKSCAEVTNYIQSETGNLRRAAHRHTPIDMYVHTHCCRGLTSAGSALPPKQQAN